MYICSPASSAGGVSPGGNPHNRTDKPRQPAAEAELHGDASVLHDGHNADDPAEHYPAAHDHDSDDAAAVSDDDEHHEPAPPSGCRDGPYDDGHGHPARNGRRVHGHRHRGAERCQCLRIRAIGGGAKTKKKTIVSAFYCGKGTGFSDEYVCPSFQHLKRFIYRTVNTFRRRTDYDCDSSRSAHARSAARFFASFFISAVPVYCLPR